MVTEGWLSPAERAKTAFPKVYPPAKKTTAGTIGYITSQVRNELANKLGLTVSDIDRGGLRIVTTISKQAQAAAVKAVADNMPSEKDAPKLHVGLTAIRPGDGAIVAMYGGKDYSTVQLNDATQATMQAGSTFKVFGLLAALQKDISTKTLFDGHSPQYFPQFKDSSNKDRFIAKGGVKNFGQGNGEQFGRIDLRKATAHSVNTIFAQLNIKLADGGTKASGVMDAAILAGLPKNTLGLGTNMSNILGTASPRVIDMANAYATIAAQGEKATPYLISTVTSTDGSIKYKVKKVLTPAFDKKVTADVTDAMTHVVTEGTGTGAQALGRPAAGKTGTTTNTEAVWFDGFTPQLSAAVGIYKNMGHDPVTVKNGNLISSGGIPVDIWTAFMRGALKGQKVVDFPPRAGVGDSSVPTPTPTTTAPTTAPTTATTAPTPTPTPTAPTTAPTTVPVPTVKKP
jgi:membrane peptidoglycan carboxypeptidase